MNTRAIVICAGEATRWSNFLGTPKHLIEIEGERILDRTVRLLSDRGIEDIYVVVKKSDERYEVKGATQYVATLNYEENADADKFLSSKPLWNIEGRTLVVYGDCYFTEEAIETITKDSRKEWLLYCRPGWSKTTGSKWGECFVQSFYPQHIEEHELALHRIAELYKSGVINRCGGWEHYRAMAGFPDHQLSSKEMKDRYVEINDWTEDFDFPQDYQKWMMRRAAHNMKIGKDKIDISIILKVWIDDLIQFAVHLKRRAKNLTA